MRSLRTFVFRGTALALAVATASCGTHTVRVRSVDPTGVAQSQYHSSFLWGTVGGADVDVPEICGVGHQAAVLEAGQNALTGLLNLVTLGIYSPWMTWVRCGVAVPPVAAVVAPSASVSASPSASTSPNASPPPSASPSPSASPPRDL